MHRLLLKRCNGAGGKCITFENPKKSTFYVIIS
jgi:hypothetical protein